MKEVKLSEMPADPFKGNRVTIHQYLGHLIPFEEKDGSIMVNATLMAKAYGKQPSHITRTQKWIDFVEAKKQSIEEKQDKTTMQKSILPDYQAFIDDPNCTFLSWGEPLVLVKNGGNTNEKGTWLHEKLAVEFARGLDIKFSIWCDDVIQELLAKRVVNIDTVAAPKLSIKQRLDTLLGGDETAIFDTTVSKGVSNLFNEDLHTQGGKEACIQENADISKMVTGRNPTYLKKQYKSTNTGIQILRDNEPVMAAAITFIKAEKLKNDVSLEKFKPLVEPIKKVCLDLSSIRQQIAQG
jgi:hypothetical protein